MRIRQIFLLSVALGSMVGGVAAILFSLQQWSALEDAWIAKHESRFLISALRLPEMMNMERAFMNARLVSPGVASAAQLAPVMHQAELVDTTLEQARRLARLPADVAVLRQVGEELVKTRHAAFSTLARPRPDRAGTAVANYLAGMFRIQETAYALVTTIQQRINTINPGIGLAARLAVLAWDVRDWSGRQTTTLISYVGQGLPMAGVQAERLAEFKGRIDQKWAAARAAALQLNQTKIMAALDRVEQGYWARGGEAYETYVEPNRGRSLRLDADDLVKAARPILDSVLLLRESGLDEALRQADAHIDALRARFLAALGLVVLTVSAAFAAYVWFDRRVVLPTGQITQAILALASGERRVQVPLQGRSDELGQMARAVETLRRNALRADAAGQQILVLQQARMEEKARLLAELTQSHAELSAVNLELESLAATDALTGVPNRRSFNLVLSREWRRAQREETPIGLALLDVDHFKAYNDRYGHQAGDACLARVAAAITTALRRPGDVAARYGGEEFGVILPAADLAAARCVAETIRGAVAGLGIVHEASGCGFVTVSIGVSASIPQSSSTDAFVAGADAALYAAKADGRNRVSTASVARELLAL